MEGSGKKKKKTAGVVDFGPVMNRESLQISC